MLSPRAARLAGILPALTMLAMIGYEFTAQPLMLAICCLFAAATVAVYALGVSASRLIFVAIAAALVLWAALTRGDWLAATGTALARGALVIALFTALSAIRSAAITSPAIMDCGRFLARRPPGLRYIALTIGGHLFGLILLYGSISLLGSLATESARDEPDPLIRRHRTRRMMNAIQRGFASMLCWSPLGFSMAITISVVPGANWANAALPCIITALILMVVGWRMDAAFKPISTAPPPAQAIGVRRWLVALSPLLILLSIVMGAVVVVHLVTGVEVIGVVMALVPLIAILWIAGQTPADGLGRAAWIGSRIHQFVTEELPNYRAEVVLLFMAGFIGSLGAYLLVPIVQASGIDLTRLPPWVILVAMVWLIPLTGQIGMNPILAVSLIVPLLPSPADMGIPPTALVAAITGGWALSGATSPFTASVLIAAALARVSPREAGLGWNGLYTLVAGLFVSAWALLLALVL